jgi:hypothetical protein
MNKATKPLALQTSSAMPEHDGPLFQSRLSPNYNEHDRGNVTYDQDSRSIPTLPPETSLSWFQRKVESGDHVRRSQNIVFVTLLTWESTRRRCSQAQVKGPDVLLFCTCIVDLLIMGRRCDTDPHCCHCCMALQFVNQHGSSVRRDRGVVSVQIPKVTVRACRRCTTLPHLSKSPPVVHAAAQLKTVHPQRGISRPVP